MGPVSAPTRETQSASSAPPADGTSRSVPPPGFVGESITTPSGASKPARKPAVAGDKRKKTRQSRRLVALIIDNIVCLPLLVPCFLVMDLVGGTRMGVGFLWLAASLLYFFLLELRTGQTVGKRVMGLRVVRYDGKPVDVMGIGARNCLRPIDSIPGIPLIGALSMALTGERRARIGDLAGRTVVAEADEHDFVRGPWSPLIVVYPLVWIAMAIGGGLLASGSKDNYLAAVDNICRMRIEAQNRGATNALQVLALSEQETRLIESMDYPPNLWKTQNEIVALKHRVDGVAEAILREAAASNDPQRVWQARQPQLVSVAKQVNARFEEMGLYYCAR
jgi:uncharacterized RDD family membrane protein YckC